MRMHIEIEDDLIRRVDAISGRRGRSRFVREALRRAVEVQGRFALLISAAGRIPPEGHAWDADPAAWVHRERRRDRRRQG